MGQQYEDGEYRPIQRNDVRINSRIDFYGPVIIGVLFFGGAGVLVGMFIFAIYAVTHWSAFVKQTATIWDDALLVIGALACILVAFCAIAAFKSLVEVFLAIFHGIASVYRAFSEARGQRYKNRLVALQDNVVVTVDRFGDVVVTPLMIEKHTYSHKGAPEIVEAGVAAILPPPRVLSFAELLRDGTIAAAQKRGELVLGYVNGALRLGSWKDIYSCAVAGISGSGKTTTVLLLLFQAVMAGAKLVMIDPHLHDEEESLAARLMSLRKAFHADPIDDTDPGKILMTIRWFKKELRRRKAGGKKGRLLIFVIDEFTAVMRNQEIKKEMADLLLEIEQEGRKFGVFALLIGQVWTAQQIGGADLRNCLASRIVHRIDEAYAKLLLGSKYGRECIELQTGHSYYRDTQGGTHKLIIPATYREDGYTVATILGWPIYRAEAAPEEAGIEYVREEDNATTSQPLPETGLLEPVGNSPRMPGKQPEVESEQFATMRRMIAEHKSQNEIILACFPGMRNADAIVAYRRALAQIMFGKAVS